MTELEQLKLNDGNELSNLEEELKLLENAEEIQQKLQNTTHIIDLSDYSILGQLQEVKILLQSISSNHDLIRELSERVESTYIEIKDVLTDIESLVEGIEHNPERLSILSDRVSLINKLLQKHQLVHPEQLIALQKQLNQELNNIQSTGEQLEKLQKEVAESYKISCDLA